MKNEHLTSFRVENFKKFDALELTDIGQFNLIVGDNNVGKTCLLESLLVTEDAEKTIANLRSAVQWRGVEFSTSWYYDNFNKKTAPEFNYFEQCLKNRALPLEVTLSSGHNLEKTTKISIKQNGDQLNWSVDGKAPLKYHRYVETEDNYISFVPFAHTTGSDLVDFYSNLANQGRLAVKEFISIIKVFISDIEEITINKIGDENSIFLGLSGSDAWQPLQMFGDGTKRLFRIALEIAECRNSRLMIDEIDSGVHFSKLKGFLKTVFEMSIANNVQLFMTTHSRECQQAFTTVFEDEKLKSHQSKVRQFTLDEKPNGQILASRFTWEQLEFSLETENETRGGR